MNVHLVNPSDNSFGTAVITPRWLFVLAAATPQAAGDPILVDESLEPIVPESIMPGDIVGISVHTGNALRGYEVGRMARGREAWVIYGGIHATLYPEEAFERGGAHAVVKGDGDIAWGKVVTDCLAGQPSSIYEGGRIEGSQFLAARWDLMPRDKYMWASVQTIRGCPKHCSFCSVWRTDGQKPRQRQYQSVIDEVVALRRLGFRFIALADDNFYPVTLTDLRLAREQNNIAKLEELTTIRTERFLLMEELARLPKDMVFFTQITMEAGEDGEFLDAIKLFRAPPADRHQLVLPRTSECGTNRLAAHRLHGRDHIGTELGVPIEDQEALRLFAAFPSFVQLQLDPKGVGIASHVMVKDPTPVMADHEKAVQNAESQGRHSEEVHRCDRLAMITKKSQPALGQVRRSWCSPNPSRDCWFR
jgi:hypothetical protein